ncbi:hypothetical protein [Sphaerisporangium perillae]|uniref:hypothetical protein n=1 Tax=Sphaerisporangium perillae TaxID=2935860 RepID=UPI00201012FA|nr:hypothetical protein [Sphaerisporangium perillae]
MNDRIIRRLRDATTAAGNTVERAPVLRLDESRTEGASRTRKAWIVPVAAAASVTLAIAVGVAGVRSGGDGARVAAAGTSTPPKFLVTASGDRLTVLAVDGGTTASVPRPSPGELFGAVQAAQDNRLFYATTLSKGCVGRFYRLMLDDSGQVGSFGAIPLVTPDGFRPTSLAVSGDGTKLAYGLARCDVPDAAGRLVLADTATGESRTWTSAEPHGVINVSMSADGRYIAYQHLGGVPRSFPGTGTPQPVPPGTAGPRSAEPAIPETSEPSMLTSAKPVTPPEAVPATELPSAGTEPIPPSPAATPSDPDDSAAGPLAVPEVTLTATTEPEVTLTATAGSEVTLTATADPEPGVPESVTEDPVLQSATGDPLVDTVTVDPGSPGQVGGYLEMLPDSPELYLLDATSEGDTLDASRKITLKTTLDSVSGPVQGLRLSADGSRVIASLGQAAVMLTGGRTQVPPSPAAIVEFGTADGEPMDVVYRDDKGGMLLVDADGATERFIVRRGPELGAVSKATGYQRIADDETGLPQAAW